MRSRTLAVIAVNLLLPAGVLGAQRDSTTSAATLRGLRAADSTWSARSADSGLAAIVPAFDGDSWYLAAGQPLLHGTGAIAASLRGGDTHPARRVTWRPVRAEISRDGGLAYTFGYTTTVAPPNDSVSRGKYIAVWRRRGAEWAIAALSLTPGAIVDSSDTAAAPRGARESRAWWGEAIDARRAAMAADSAFARYASAHGVADAFVTYAAPDGASLSGPTRIAFGRDAIRASFAGLPTGARLDWAPVDGQGATSGDLAFTVGNAVLSVTDTAGRTRRGYSKYLTVWRRHPDGAWRFAVDGGSARPRPAATPSAIPDSAHPTSSPFLTAKDAWLAGGFALGTIALFPLDRHLAQRIRDPRAQENRFLENVATDVRLTADPGAVLIGVGLYAVGRIGRWRRVADLGLHGTEAIVVGSVVTSAIKLTTGRARPYVVADTNPRDFQLLRGLRHGNAYQSFPSGHALAAFAAAATVTDETTRWWPHSTWYVGPLMYGGATLVGLSRMYNDKHWGSDVMLGAAIGTFAGRKVFWFQHSHPNNALDRWLLSAIPGGVMVTARL